MNRKRMPKGVIHFIVSFTRALFFHDKSLDAVNDSGEPLVLGDPNPGYNIKHVAPNGAVYIYKGTGWINSEIGKTYDEEQEDF